MIKKISCFIILLIFFIQLTSPVLSEESEDAQDKVTLLKGSMAPFDGVLFSEKKVKELRQIKFECELEKDLRKQERELMLKKLDESRVPWYDKPTIRTLWGMIIAYLSVFAAKQL